MQSILKALITPSGNEYTYANYQLVDSPQGKVRPGISVSGVRDSTLVISEGKLGAIDVVLDKPGNVTIDFSLSVGGVVLADKTTLTFTTANWNVPQALTLKAIDDDLIDGAESVVMTLSVNDAATTTNEFDALSDIVIPVFNVNDDVPRILTSLSGGMTLTEGAGGQVVNVSLSHRPTSNVTISVTSLDPQQAAVSVASLIFTPSNWSTPQSTTFTATDDQLADGNINTELRLSVVASTDPAFRSLAGVALSASLIDNEIPELLIQQTDGDTLVSEDGLSDTISVRLAVQPVGNVFVAVQSSDTSAALVSSSELLFTSANWDVSRTITISGVNDSVLDGDQNSLLLFSVDARSSAPYRLAGTRQAVVRTLDDENARLLVDETNGTTVVTESGTSDTVTVRLAVRPIGTVVVDVTTGSPLDVSIHNSALTFTSANWDQPQTVTITAIDDVTADGNMLSSLMFSRRANSSAPYGLTPSQTISVRKIDNELASFVIQQSAGSTVVNESGTIDTIRISLTSRPVGTVVVQIASDDASEVRLSPTVLTFTASNWNIAQSVNVTGIDDLLADGNQTANITVSVNAALSQGAYSSTPAVTILSTTVDNEIAGLIISQTDGTTVVSEAGSSDTVAIRLASAPIGTVRVLVSASDASEASASPLTLTFTPANWQTAQIVTVAGMDGWAGRRTGCIIADVHVCRWQLRRIFGSTAAKCFAGDSGS